MIAEATGDSTPDTAGRSQTDVVIQGIKDMITGGELVAGSRLPIEKDLSARFSVSRGSLREGVRALATLGVLETRQGDGTYVTSLDPALLLSPIGFLADLQTPADSAHLLAVRRILEAESAARAALLLTDRSSSWSSRRSSTGSTTSCAATTRSSTSRATSTPTPSSTARSPGRAATRRSPA